MEWNEYFKNAPLGNRCAHCQKDQRWMTIFSFSWGLTCGCKCTVVSAFPEAARPLPLTRSGPSGKVASVSASCSTKNFSMSKKNKRKKTKKTNRKKNKNMNYFFFFFLHTRNNLTMACLWHWRSRHFCLFLLLPPNLGLSTQKSHVPQSLLHWHAWHWPQARRFRFLCHWNVGRKIFITYTSSWSH